MTGTTVATFNGVSITQDASAKEGVLFFKGNGIGGSFTNVEITANENPLDPSYGVVYTTATAGNLSTVTFNNVDISSHDNGTNNFVGGVSGSAIGQLESIFDACATCSETDLSP
jgi:hypothetical protein